MIGVVLKNYKISEHIQKSGRYRSMIKKRSFTAIAAVEEFIFKNKRQ